MRSTRFFVSGLAVFFLCAALSAGATTSRFSSASLASAATFTDPVGDSNGAPDITKVAISDDFATGSVNLAVTATGGTGTNDSVLNVWFDTDKNAATGDRNGNEYVTAVAMDGLWAFERWNGTDYESAFSPTVQLGKDGDTWIWTFNKTDLGGTSGFAIYVIGAVRGGGRDRAPDAGAWTYDLATEPPPPDLGPLVIASPTTTPANAVAGKRFSVSFWVTWSETGEGVESAKMVFTPTLAGKVLPHTESLKEGIARLSLKIPKSAKGKLLKVKLTITSSGQSATRAASFRVR